MSVCYVSAADYRTHWPTREDRKMATAMTLVEKATLQFNDEQIGRQILDRTRINTITGCLEFVGAVCSGGYGTVRMSGRTVAAHRAVYQSVHGPLPKSVEVCHSCDNRRCVNIEHLFAGSRLDNQRDMYRKGRGRKASGESHWKTRLTWSDVRSLRAMRAAGAGYTALMERFGLSKSAVHDIIAGHHWKESRL